VGCGDHCLIGLLFMSRRDVAATTLRPYRVRVVCCPRSVCSQPIVSKWNILASFMSGSQHSDQPADGSAVSGPSDGRVQWSLCVPTAFNPLNPELNPICYLLALLAHHFLHVNRIRVKSLTLRLLMSYIYGASILDVSRSHNDAA